jgi:pyruvate dehydrogenase E1 component alpha subunit
MGIVGSGGPIAVGAAIAAQRRKSGQVIVCFFGDGASNTGAFHESANFSALHKLPVVFICENNLYGISVSMERHTALKNIADRAQGYAMPGVSIDGNDVLKVYRVVEKAVKSARAGEGPTLIECKTYRFRGHFEGDPNLGTRYRTQEEMEKWKSNCPIKRFKDKILEKKLFDIEEIGELEREIKQRVEEAIVYADSSVYPEAREIFEDLFA